MAENEWSPRTDLAIEISEGLKQNQSVDYQIEGVKVETFEEKENQITVSTVSIVNELGAKEMGRPQGKYITIECPYLRENEPEIHKRIIDLLAKQLQTLLPQKEALKVLVIGLGNQFATPDTLGPKVANKVLVTRHIKKVLPDEIDESVAELSSLAPGVMGLTGIETSEIIEGVSKNIAPDCIIAIDALAARNAKRINTTIQLSNTGIAPGAGVGNKRKPINEATVGCTVIAIGVPTVVEAVTLVNDTLDELIKGMLEASKDTDFYGMLENLSYQEKYHLIKEILRPQIGDLFVTPKEIDEIIEYLTHIISSGINLAVHQGIHLEDISQYVF